MEALRDYDPVLTEIVRRLVQSLKPERIYLFGSKARGEAGPDSDYDLLAIVPHAAEPSYRLAQKAHSVLWDLGTSVDILVWSKDAFDSRLHLRASFPSAVVREGQLLYAVDFVAESPDEVITDERVPVLRVSGDRPAADR